MDQMEQENGELKETIQRLELDLSNLPVGDCGTMREASVQITQLLQTLNEDMVKAPELCTRLRMAAQQVSSFTLNNRIVSLRVAQLR